MKKKFMIMMMYSKPGSPPCCVAGGLRGIEFSYKLLLMLRYQIRSQYVKKENSSSGIYNSKMVFIIEFQTRSCRGVS